VSQEIHLISCVAAFETQDALLNVFEYAPGADFVPLLGKFAVCGTFLGLVTNDLDTVATNVNAARQEAASSHRYNLIFYDSAVSFLPIISLCLFFSKSRLVCRFFCVSQQLHHFSQLFCCLSRITSTVPLLLRIHQLSILCADHVNWAVLSCGSSQTCDGHGDPREPPSSNPRSSVGVKSVDARHAPLRSPADMFSE
jgi:hypothetical protein